MRRNRQKWVWLAVVLMVGCGDDRLPANGNPGATVPTLFEGVRAYEMLTKQVDFGTRHVGSPGHARAASFLLETLAALADTAYVEPFTYFDSKVDTSVSLINVVGVFNPDSARRFLLCAHWDTRPYADRDPNPANRQTPIPGANDGASGVAVLLEVARVLSADAPRVGVDIVLFDGEDYGRGIGGDVSDYFLGAREFARRRQGVYRPEMGLLLDMIGDRNLNIHVERNSQAMYPDVVAKVWNAAEALGLEAFHREPKYSIQDDHIPLMEAGMPVIDLIDFDYPPWHTLGDTPDKCSAESLQAVGDLVMHLVRRM
jgi:glutaminyl-peptide cyclotransferase